MLLQLFRAALCSGLLVAVSVSAHAASQATRESKAIDRLVAENAGATVSVHPATGAARFVRLPATHVRAAARTEQARQEGAAAFVNRYAAALGLRSGMADLAFREMHTDRLGQTHLSYTQRYEGIPVFGAVLKVHYDARGQISIVNGTMVPGIDVAATPSRGAAEAIGAAVRFVTAQKPGVTLTARNSRLVVFREGLVKGVPGANHLAYEVEVSDGASVREFVYVDAHTNKVLDQINGAPDGMYRRAYDGMSLPTVPPTYPDSPFWVEGDLFPTSSTEANNMILASKETYDLYLHAFGVDSFDGQGAIMDSIFNRGYSCPNASWNGAFISFCEGLTTDDVTGHEWSHAYTQYTDGLIYQWQSGALNEASSDIFGETVDRINGRGGDNDAPRTTNGCTVEYGAPPPSLNITGGLAAGDYQVLAAAAEPQRPFIMGPRDMEIALPTGACSQITSNLRGKIAIIEWTEDQEGNSECLSSLRAENAKMAGALGVIFVAPPSGLLNLAGSQQIGSVQVNNQDGAKIKAGLPAQATISLDVGSDQSTRWVIGEDIPDGGAFRDMWNPRCLGNPGAVTDTFEYWCSTDDAGGVHINSGVDNHAYALLVDGGTYNNQTITPIGLTKSAHIWFRAKREYQTPTTDFADHADALEQACADLIGTNLASLTTGEPSGETISAADCEQVATAMLATAMREPPVQCNFQPLLAQDPPELCDAPMVVQRLFFRDSFEDGDGDGWSVSHEGTPDFTERDWTVVTDLPDERRGTAFFAPATAIGSCAPGDDQSAVLHLDSPLVAVKGQGGYRIAFDHWVATEPDYDGANLKVSVGGKAWQVISPEHYVYNPYNTTLIDAASGNTNPLAGEPAFSGTDGGTLDGSWGRSIINLDPYVSSRNAIQLRFDVGTDGCSGAFGWYLARVWVYQCH